MRFAQKRRQGGWYARPGDLELSAQSIVHPCRAGAAPRRAAGNRPAGHAGYNNQAILCDRTGLEAFLGAHPELPADVRRKARELRLEPIVERDGPAIIVRVVTFTRWGGFIEESYTLRRDPPHQLSMPEKRTLVAYDCSIVY